MKKPLLIGAAAVFLLIAVPVFIKTDDLILDIDCPATYNIGELIVLDASKSQVKDLEWAIFPSTANFKIDGKRAYFSSTDRKTYTIVLAGTNGKTVNCLFLTLSYQKGSEPKPDLIDPFTLKLKSWLPAEYTQITAYKLAQSFRSVAAVSKNNFNDLEAMLLATAYSNRVALDNDFSTWKPFLDELSKELEANPPTSILDCAKKWEQIADTLEKLISQ